MATMTGATDQSRTNLGSLTTTYTPNPACTVLVAQCNTCSVAWQAQTCGFLSTDSSGSTSSIAADNSGCWPPRVVSVASSSPPFSGYGFYSPGLICPAGFTTACSATEGSFSNWQVQYSMLPGETAVGCCPNGYTCANNGYAQTCQTIVSFTSFPTVTCQSGTSGGFGYATVPAAMATNTISTYRLYAPLVQLNWQASDRPSSTGTSSATSTSTQSPISSQKPSSGLATGAKAGIGVGVAVSAMVVTALALLCWRRRKHYYAQAPQPGSPVRDEPAYELPGAKRGPYSDPELPPKRMDPSELPPRERRQTPGDVHELGN